MKKNRSFFINTFMVLGLLALASVVAYRLIFYSGFLGSDNDQEEEPEDLVLVVGGVSFVMKPVKGGSFLLKNADGSAGINEYQEHRVFLDSYYLGETEVTQELWQAVMGTNVVQQRDKANPLGPLRGMGSEYPMYYVSWYECNEFIRKLNLLTGRDFRFPTEAEWEYAAKGGNKSNGYKYAGSNTLSGVAWYADNSGQSTHLVKNKMPNELGLYDMIGNVWEWCGDSYNNGNQYYVLRGGSWYSGASSCSLAARHNLNFGCRETCYGFRLAMDLKNQKREGTAYLMVSEQMDSFSELGEMGTAQNSTMPEQFTDFWNSFCHDSAFQQSRIRLPLPYTSHEVSFDEEGNEVEKQNTSTINEWQFEEMYDAKTQIDIEIRDDLCSVTRNWINVVFSMEYFFEQHDERWFLTHIHKYSI